MHYWDANDREQESEDRPADDGSLPGYTLRRLKRVPIIHETANGPEASGWIVGLQLLVARIVPRGLRLSPGNRGIFHHPELIRQFPASPPILARQKRHLPSALSNQFKWTCRFQGVVKIIQVVSERSTSRGKARAGE